MLLRGCQHEKVLTISGPRASTVATWTVRTAREVFAANYLASKQRADFHSKILPDGTYRDLIVPTRLRGIVKEAGAFSALF
jgi:hypothetical protein